MAKFYTIYLKALLCALVALPLAPLKPPEEAVLLASGVVSVEEINISSEFQGQVIRLAAKEGEAVSKGQALATLHNATIEGQLEQAKAALAAAEADLALARRGPREEAVAAARAQVALAEANEANARARLDSARAARENLQDLRGKVLEAETKLKLAEQAVEAATADYHRSLYERDRAKVGSAERRTLDFIVKANEAALQAARAEQKAAATSLSHLRSILANPLSLEAEVHRAAGEKAVAEAATRVAMARLSDLLAGPRPEEVAVAEARVELARAQLELAQAQYERLTLRAPCAGLVLKQVAELGETVMPATTIFVLADLHRVTVTVYVPEPKLGQVRLGQRAEVRVDSFPSRLFEGTVTYIADHAEYTPRNVATREGRKNTFFAVEISVTNDDLALKPGMPADVTFK